MVRTTCEKNIGGSWTNYDHSFDGVNSGGCRYTSCMPRKNNIPKKNPDELLKRQAYGIAMYGTAEEYKNSEDEKEDFNSVYFGDGWEEQQAPSSGRGGKNRAEWVGYHRELQWLVIVFRANTVKDPKNGRQVPKKGAQEPWFVYEEVTLEDWDDLMTGGSTGDWLRFTGNFHPFHQCQSNDRAGLEAEVKRALASQEE